MIYITKNKVNTIFSALISGTLLFACGSGNNSEVVEPDQDIDPVAIDGNWNLVWSDEFDGESIDESKWGFEENCMGGGNNEQQCYTKRSENAFVTGGVLTIRAQREDYTGALDPGNGNTQNTTLPYTSARLRTLNKGDWQYGRFEVRAKLPQGQGTWPAIWMLPTDWVYGGWAASGEIDIMEAVNLKTLSDDVNAVQGELESRVHGTLHYGKAWPENVYSGESYKLADGINPADDYHTYAVEWQEGEIRWYVDDVHFATQKESGWYSQYKDDNGDLVNGANSAPFNQKFHLLLNLAVGGAWAANTNDKGIDESVFPQSMLVDYVRVYQCSIAPDTGAGCATVGDNAKLIEGHNAPEILIADDSFGVGPVFTLYDDEVAQGLAFNSYNPDSTISFIEQDEGERGQVIAVSKTGGTGNVYLEYLPRVDLSHWAADGELVFDLNVTSMADGVNLLVKIDSGWPSVSDIRVSFDGLSQWQEIRIPIASLIASGNSYSPGNSANLADVINVFVIEPDGEMTLMLDNIRFE
jgi:beta-glucanase (GH16 family)